MDEFSSEFTYKKLHCPHPLSLITPNSKLIWIMGRASTSLNEYLGVSSTTVSYKL